jgi:hypothetical protein
MKKQFNKRMIKVLSINLLLLISLNAFAQFPVPTDFQFNYTYIMIEQSGFCEGQVVGGPTYCSAFSWNAPDTTGLPSQLEFYRIYYKIYFMQDSTPIIIAEVNETFHEMQIGILGEIWVTAVYSNPDGESEPSNIIINDDLPISIEEQNNTNQFQIIYDREKHCLNFSSVESDITIRIYDLNGRCIISTVYNGNDIQLVRLKQGLYILEAGLPDSKTIHKKILF